jgi:hypothetical protein
MAKGQARSNREAKKPKKAAPAKAAPGGVAATFASPSKMPGKPGGKAR